VDVGTAAEIASRRSELAIPLPISSTESYPVIVPGLIDSHAHLPQYPAVARIEESLLPWLKRHIFPLETGFTGEDTREIISAFFDEVVANGTTTIVLYGAIWEDSCDIAFQIASERGLRVILGKVMMDDGTYGSLPADSARDVSVAQTVRLCEKWHGANDGQLQFAVSPRFAVTCSREMMEDAAEIAKEHGCYIQTHLSENHGEIQAVAERFPWAKDYTDVYDQCGLLTDRTLLGHCIHLSEREMKTIQNCGSIIAHCPTSNLFLNSGLYPWDKTAAHGIRTTLASDVAGGPELNMWQVMRSAIEIQKARRFADPAVPELTPVEAFRHATVNTAQVLSHNTGLVANGFDADLCVFDLNRVLPYGGRFTRLENPTADEILTTLIYRGQPGALIESYIAGRRVSSPPERP